MIRHVVPHKATGPDCLTLLRAPGRRLTKLIAPDGIAGYEGAGRFKVEARRVDRVEDIAALLVDLSARPDTCIVRAALKVPVHPWVNVPCRIHDRPGQPALFAEVPRSWVMVDLEPAACPVDPTDPELAGGWLRRRLPAPFQMARCVAQLSSSAGVKPGGRAHLWFVTDRALVNAELDRLLAGVVGLDASTLRPRQIHYIADPVFDGVDDPCHERIAVLPGYAEVAVPELAPERPRAAFAPGGRTPTPRRRAGSASGRRGRSGTCWLASRRSRRRRPAPATPRSCAARSACSGSPTPAHWMPST